VVASHSVLAGSAEPQLLRTHSDTERECKQLPSVVPVTSEVSSAVQYQLEPCINIYADSINKQIEQCARLNTARRLSELLLAQ
jgi:hypothetical protein